MIRPWPRRRSARRRKMGEVTMPVVALDHVNIRTKDMAGTVAFFRDVLGMRVAPPPGMESTDNGAWVYDESDAAVIHIGSDAIRYTTDAERPFTGAQGTGAIHHVALRCENVEAVRTRLRA